MNRGGTMIFLTWTPVVAEIRLCRRWSFGVIGQGTSLCGGRAFTLDAFVVLHWWLADDKRGKNPKAIKREEYEMIISIRWRVNL
jgi:hypothetical protein